MKRVTAWFCPRCGLLTRDSVKAHSHIVTCPDRTSSGR